MILEESNKFLRENVVKNLDSILPKKNREREDDLSFVLEVKKK